MSKTQTKQLPRGIRNNNPMNIRIGNTWLGEVSNPTDSEFEQFISAKYGLRAAFCILRRYIKRYHKNTISSIIHTWAPATENNTRKYIEFVSSKLNMSPEDPISFEDEDTMCLLAQAMSQMECGVNINLGVIHESYKMA